MCRLVELTARITDRWLAAPLECLYFTTADIGRLSVDTVEAVKFNAHREFAEGQIDVSNHTLHVNLTYLTLSR